MAVTWRLSEVVDAADRLRSSAANAEQTLEHQFVRWVEGAAEAMREEIPKDTEQTADSVTVEYGDGLTASIGPTNTDERGRPIAVFIAYGTGRQAPDDFIGRTSVRAGEMLDAFDVSEVL